MQLGLFGENAVHDEGLLPADTLYSALARRGVSFGGRGTDDRWYHALLKNAGVVERMGDVAWRTTADMHEITAGSLLGFHTEQGACVVSDCADFFRKVRDKIDLIVTSPPYPVKFGRNYGKVREKEYVEWLCERMEPALNALRDGGSLFLNVGNDVFLPKSQARSLYRERLVLALSDMGMHKIDELIWNNPNKPPSPLYATIKHTQLRVGWEPVYWFSNNPEALFTSNRRVLEPHSEEHLRFLKREGKKFQKSSDGRHQKSPSSYSRVTEGRIPRNVLNFPHDVNRNLRRTLEEIGLPGHGATMPYALAEFLVKFGSREGDLVIDPFGGSMTVPLAAEKNGRRWLATDKIFEYAQIGAVRFGMERVLL